jgi:hypothetical protein
VAVALAAFGIVRGGRRARALALVALVAWLLALGSHTPVFRIAYEVIPGTEHEEN